MQPKDLARLTALAVVTVFVGQAVTGTANATTYVGGTLANVTSYDYMAARTATLTGTDLKGWSYNDVANSLTASGPFQDQFHILNGPATIYTDTISGLVLNTGGAAAAATSFACSEGTLGPSIFVTFCGNYTFGANGVDESTAQWGPGTAYSRSIGGDDTIMGLQHNLSWYDGFHVISFSGGTLTIGNTDSNSNLSLATSGYTFTVTGLIAVPDIAASIPGLFNTGVLDDTTPAPDGSVDTHYLLVDTPDVNFPGPDAFVANPIPTGSWLANSTTSRWIAPAVNQGYPSGAASHAGGSYVYRLSFYLTGLDPATAQISGSWAADDSGIEIYLNGVSTGNTASGYSSLTPFVLGSGFVSGTNTLVFFVNNVASAGANPTGLRVQDLVGTANVAAPQDTDSDGVADAADNCPSVANANQADSDLDLRGNACDNCRSLANNTGVSAQCDSDADGFGNRCDGDMNNNNVTNNQDYGLFRAQLGQPSVSPTYNKADINCNGTVNNQDYGLFRGLLGAPPGPGAGP